MRLFLCLCLCLPSQTTITADISAQTVRENLEGAMDYVTRKHFVADGSAGQPATASSSSSHPVTVPAAAPGAASQTPQAFPPPPPPTQPPQEPAEESPSTVQDGSTASSAVQPAQVSGYSSALVPMAPATGSQSSAAQPRWVAPERVDPTWTGRTPGCLGSVGQSALKS